MTFSIDIREKDGLRTLHFDSDRVQGAMRIAQPYELALEYTREMMACLLMRDADRIPRSILLIGLGAGSQAKFLYRHCPRAHLTAVEISPRVVDAAREHFELPDDPARLEIVIGDGCEYMQTTGKVFDLILVDGFNEHAHPGDLNTLPFYRACRARLSGQGLIAVNLIGLSHGYKGGYAHIETAFDRRAALFPKCKSGNTIAFAATGETIDISLDELQDRARAFEARTGLAFARFDNGDPVVKGRKVSAFTNSEEAAAGLAGEVPFLLETRLSELGAEIRKAPNFQPFAIADGNLITGQNPASAEKAAKLVIKQLKARHP